MDWRQDYRKLLSSVALRVRQTLLTRFTVFRNKLKIGGKIPEQLNRVAIVVAIIIIGVLAIRYYVIPPSLIETRLHQQSTIQREVAKKIKFAGTIICGNCHVDEKDSKEKSFHKNVSCETCHGPSVKHTIDPVSIKPIAPRKRIFCPSCHAYDPSRPTGFPQINPIAHNPLQPCITCHNPHDPKPPTVPEECSACHAEIARTKAVSHHALVACTTCHVAPESHKLTPRIVRPAKPETREFCGNCHGQEAERKDSPKIDLFTHGNRYLCWQCHYPHLPGVI
jgi:hypothetical protein